MKKIIYVLLFLPIIGFSQTKDITEFRGPYFGQKPPGMVPEIFAPGVVSTGMDDWGCTFMPDGKECYWYIYCNGFETIVVSKQINGIWTKPEVAEFCSRFSDGYPKIHPDGSKLFFDSFRPLDGSTERSKESNIWYTVRNGDNWESPKPIGTPINGNGSVFGPSISSNGNLYFNCESNGSIQLMRSKFMNGEYQNPEILFEGTKALHICISPNEDYLILPIYGRKDAIGKGANYYVTFRDENDNWSEMVNLGKEINNGGGTYHSGFSPDGKYFFYASKPKLENIHRLDKNPTYSYIQELSIKSPTRNRYDVFWIDALVIEELKPKELK